MPSFLKDTHPNIFNQIVKNENIDYDKIPTNSTKRFMFKCDQHITCDMHIWKTSLYHRVNRNHNCPWCSKTQKNFVVVQKIRQFRRFLFFVKKLIIMCIMILI